MKLTVEDYLHSTFAVQAASRSCSSSPWQYIQHHGSRMGTYGTMLTQAVQHFYAPTRHQDRDCAARSALALRCSSLGNLDCCTSKLASARLSSHPLAPQMNWPLPLTTSCSVRHLKPTLLSCTCRSLSPHIRCHSLHTLSLLTYPVTPYIRCHPLHTLAPLTYAVTPYITCHPLRCHSLHMVSRISLMSNMGLSEYMLLLVLSCDIPGTWTDLRWRIP